MIGGRLDELERLAARVEVEIRRERERRRLEPTPIRPAHRPPIRQPDDHGTERDYQAHRAKGEPACEVCKAGHALYNRRRAAARRATGVVRQRRGGDTQLTIYDALADEESTG